jgi:hypothetical protein
VQPIAKLLVGPGKDQRCISADSTKSKRARALHAARSHAADLSAHAGGGGHAVGMVCSPSLAAVDAASRAPWVGMRSVAMGRFPALSIEESQKAKALWALAFRAADSNCPLLARWNRCQPVLVDDAQGFGCAA